MRVPWGSNEVHRGRFLIALLTVALVAAPAAGPVAQAATPGLDAGGSTASSGSTGSFGSAGSADAAADAGPAWNERARAWFDDLQRLLAAAGADGPAVLGDRGDRSADQQVAAVEAFPLGARLEPLGDADGDGHADLLVTSYDDEEHTATFVARSGADPGRAIWTWEAPEDGWADLGPDADGDAVRDLQVLRYPGSEGVGVGQCVVAACAFAGQYEARRVVGLVAGADGGEAWERGYTWDGGYGSVSAGALVGGAYGSGSQGGYVTTLVRDGMPGTTYVFHTTYRSGFGGAFSVAASLFAYGTDVDLTVDILDADGSARARVELADPTRTVMMPFVRPLGDLTGDGVPDLAAAHVERWPAGSAFAGTAVGGAGAGTLVTRTDIVVFDGSDGSTVWTVEGDPVAGVTVPLATVGDVTGDGAEDLHVIQLLLDAEGDFEFRAVIRSGTDGSIVGEKRGQTLALALPFGDADGDGTDEVLLLETDMEFSSLTAGPAGADLEPLWTEEVGLNALFFLLFGVIEGDGAADWDGDGTVDLPLVTGGDGAGLATPESSSGDGEDGEDDEPLDFTVHAGPTGDALWTRELGPSVVHHVPLGEATGPGERDLVLLTAAAGNDDDLEDAVEDGDYDNATAHLVLVRGEDGRRAWRQTVLRPDWAGNRSLEGVRFTVTSIGDLDADGYEDVAVQVRSDGPPGDGPRAVPEDDGDGDDDGNASAEEDEDAVEREGLDQLLLISGHSGRLLFAEPALPETTAPPEAEPLEGYPDDVGEQGTGGAALPGPSAALVALVVAGAAVALAAGKRKQRP